jgi:predicted Zn-dependent protease
MRRKSSILHVALIVALGADVAASAQGQTKDQKGAGSDFYSRKKEIALGKQMTREIEREARLVDDPLPAEFLNRLAQNQARNSDLKLRSQPR